MSIALGYEIHRVIYAGLFVVDESLKKLNLILNAGIDLYAVGTVLGHADHKSTMRYSHLANETLLAAVEAGAANMRL